jgi:hypothetical protein
MEIMKAHRQWASRPADERFWTLAEMRERVQRYRAEAVTAKIDLRQAKILATDENDLKLVGPTGAEAHFTHWSFGQLSSLVGAPSKYLRTLPAPLAADCLRHGMDKREDGELQTRMLLNRNGDLKVRAFTSDKYSRIWNVDVVDRLQTLVDAGWRTPPARPSPMGDPRARKATKADLMPGSLVGEGELIAPAGLYASDRDMFTLMINPTNPIEVNGANLFRGCICCNSEVGSSSLWMMTFLLNQVCGNHILWGCRDVIEISVKHVGDAEAKAFSQMQIELRKYADSSISDEVAVIEKAQKLELGADKNSVLDFLFAKKIAPRSTLELAYVASEQHPEDGGGSPRSAWGMVQGLTRVSQTEQNFDQRMEIDKAAGKVLEMAF